MPVKLRNPKARQHRITPEAIEAFRLAREIEATPGARDAWEEDGGRRREYLDASSALHRALGLRPWHVSPLDVDPEDEPLVRKHLEEKWPDQR